MKRHVSVLCLLVGLMGCEPPKGRVGPGSYPQSGTVHVSRDGRQVFVLSKDHRAVLVVNPDGTTVREVGVGEGPSAMARTDDDTLVVTNEQEGSVSVVDPAAGMELNRVYVGVEPSAVVVRGHTAFIALAREAAVVELDLATGQLGRRFTLARGEPRGLALVGDRLLVSHFYAGEISTLDLATGGTTVRTDMRMPTNPLLFPNQLSSLTVSPDADEVSAPHQEANNDPGGFTTGVSNTCPGAYYVDGPSGMPAVVPAVATMDPRTGRATSDTDPPSVSACASLTSGAPPRAAPTGTRPAPAVHNTFDLTVFGDAKVNTPVAVAYTDGGRGKLIVYRGSQNALLMRRTVVDAQTPVVKEWALGAGADGVALSPDGAHAYIYSQFDHVLHTLDLDTLETQTSSSLFTRPGTDAQKPAGSAATFDRAQPASHAVGSAVTVPANVARGRRLFFSATDEALTRKGAVSCQSCHPMGRTDGMRWTFGTTKMRNTPQLGGGIGNTAPFHWDGDRPDKDSMNETVGFFMGGAGLSVFELEDLWAFIDTIPKAQSPVLQNETMQASITRGEALFFSNETKCGTCHTGTLYTDNQFHAVGSEDLEPGVVFGTPVLAGLAASAPFMHDGREPTLESVVENWVRTDKMGVGSHLTDEQVVDLVNFLKSL